MRLIHLLTFRLCLVAAVVMCAWGVLFYYAMLNEINDEQDDALEDYAELVMRRFLAGEQLPSQDSGTNNQYYLHAVSDSYAMSQEHVRYLDHEIYIEYKRETEPARSIYYIFQDENGQHYEVGVSVPTIDKSDMVEALLWLMAILGGGIILAFGIIGLFTVHRTMKPLKRLLSWMENYKPGQRNQVLNNPTKIREFVQLNNTVDTLINRSENFERQQQLFISNASHEMQTPLAICLGRLEALLEEDTLGEHEMEEIAKTLHTLGGLSQLNKSLLMLSRIENGQYSDQQQISFTSLLEQHLSDYKQLFASKNIEVDMNLKASFALQGDEHLAKMLVLNLLKNAFVHTPSGGKINISSTNDVFRITNTAETGPLDAEKIFLPFYHAGENKYSTGLGLPLVVAVCRRYSLRINYAYDEGKHVFTVAR